MTNKTKETWMDFISGIFISRLTTKELYTLYAPDDRDAFFTIIDDISDLHDYRDIKLAAIQYLAEYEHDASLSQIPLPGTSPELPSIQPSWPVNPYPSTPSIPYPIYPYWPYVYCSTSTNSYQINENENN